VEARVDSLPMAVGFGKVRGLTARTRAICHGSSDGERNAAAASVRYNPTKMTGAPLAGSAPCSAAAAKTTRRSVGPAEDGQITADVSCSVVRYDLGRQWHALATLDATDGGAIEVKREMRDDSNRWSYALVLYGLPSSSRSTPAPT
jgi:hypothetical protein